MKNNIDTKTLLSLVVLYLGLTSTALADSVNQLPVPWSNIVLGYDKPVKQGLLGDMWGIRSDLADHGFTFRLAYLTESAYNISGGYNDNHKYAFVDDTALTFSQDLERYTDIPDAKIDGNIVDRNHDDDLTSERLINPSISRNDQAQEAANGGQSITRLGWLTFSRSFMDRKLNWRIGMMNKNQDFDQIVPCDFQLISLCGGKSAKSGLWTNWNVHTWGTAFQYKLTPEVTLKTGVLEYNPSASERSHAWSWSTQGSKGFLLPMEALWRTNDVVGLPGAYNLGVLFTNGERADLYQGNNGYHYYDHTWYIYTSFNQQLTRHADDANRGLSVSNSFGWADERTMTFKYVNSTALRYRGLFDSRLDDMMALGVTYIEASSHYQREQNYLNEINGVSDINDPLWKPVPGHSIDLDIYYRVQVTPWLAIQPEIQFWKNPAGVSETPDAWVGALKTMVTF